METHATLARNSEGEKGLPISDQQMKVVLEAARITADKRALVADRLRAALKEVEEWRRRPKLDRKLYRYQLEEAAKHLHRAASWFKSEKQSELHKTLKGAIRHWLSGPLPAERVLDALASELDWMLAIERASAPKGGRPAHLDRDRLFAHLIAIWEHDYGGRATQTPTSDFVAFANAVGVALGWGENHDRRIQRVLQRYRAQRSEGGALGPGPSAEAGA